MAGLTRWLPTLDVGLRGWSGTRTPSRRMLRDLGLLASVGVMACLASEESLAQTPSTIFGNATPHSAVNPDSAVTLGVKFWSAQAGTIAGVRFYRGAPNSNGYRVKLFNASGTLLASGSASKDTCAVPCWEEINFALPVSIAAKTTYVAAYYTSNGNYADDTYTSGGLTNGATNGPLVAPASSQVGGNGVYTYSTGFLNQTWEDSNYYVDVVFTSTAPTLLMSFNPPNPSIAANMPSGTVVATVNVSWSNGSPFTGTLGFAAPYSNDQGTFAISGNNLIINSTGPGLSSDANTTQSVTITATQ
jgi:Domain of unknown function (DUF4082)